MIRALRWRLVIVTMVLLSIVLVLSMCLFFTSIYREMEDDSIKALHMAGMRYGLHDGHSEKGPNGDMGPEKPRPDDNGPPNKDSEPHDKPDKDPEEKSPIPCFVVGYDHDGVFYTDGPGYYDLTDQAYLEQLYRDAVDTEADSGVLVGETLRFVKLADICGEAYAFTDISSELQVLGRLMTRYIMIGLLAMGCFLIISILISHWAVRPVDRVMKQQQQFIADASHELKTPLTVILTNSELLCSEEYSPEERQVFSRNNLTMAQQMRGLVEELLELARADKGVRSTQLEQIDLSQLVCDAVLPFEPVYFEAGRTLECKVDPDIWVNGNEAALLHLVEILLDNGCKYSTLGSTVKICLTRCGLKRITLSVQSSGDTLSKQECRDVFKRFYRRDPNRSMNHSYGLGLSIAKTVVRTHKGRIWMRSKKGVNTFYVRLPLKIHRK